MEIRDINPADILLFSGEKGSWISEAIMLLTNSPVSHAAMSYTSSDVLVEETPPQVRTSDTASRAEGRTLYVMRMDPPLDSMTPVLEAADVYLEQPAPYAMSNLYLVGMLLLYKRFTPGTPMQKVMLKIFKKLAAGIMKFINEHESPGKLPMVCSQFVYQCYQDAGKRYKLNIKGGILLRAAAVEFESGSVLDRAIFQVKSDTRQDFRSFIAERAGTALHAEEPQNEEELARELVEVLKADEAAVAEELEQELVLAIQEFGQAVYAATTRAAIEADDMVRSNALRIAPTGLSFLKSEEPYFVAPGDLLSHCSNVRQVGVIQ
ncbi:hypothetical protein ACGF5M_00955 [Gemmatimonadota bacterium]